MEGIKDVREADDVMRDSTGRGANKCGPKQKKGFGKLKEIEPDTRTKTQTMMGRESNDDKDLKARMRK